MSALHPVDHRAAAAWPCLSIFTELAPGVVVVDEGSGVRVRMMEDGHPEEVGEVPRRRSIAADPTAMKGGRR